MTVEFRLLGDIEVRIDGKPVDVGHARQRCVLVALLVDANRTVSVDQLADRVWGDRLPHRARGTLSSYLSRLRLALANVKDVGIARRSGGYVLTVDEMAVDLHCFHRLLAQARANDDNRALALLEQALGLWRGEAFAHLDTPWLNTIRDTLDTERFAAELDRNDLDLRRGHHTGMLTELSTCATTHPLDERLAGQLMLALYRSGRQADALDHYQRTRLRLAEELGTDPSPPLQRLHRQILTADPALAVPATRSTLGSATRPVPHQLPAPPRLFNGRARELTQLTNALNTAADRGRTMVISAIGGAGGIGKTWLALRWAHQNAERFPDGQLYVNLRGFDPSSEPMPPPVAIRGFLDALEVDPSAIPVDADAQAALYRSLVASKRMLVVLDNARDSAHVTQLLPGSPACAVLVTSRHQLTGLATTHGATPLDLDVLPEADSRELLNQHLGNDRVCAEPQAVAELLKWCGGFPLALGIVTARAATHPSFPLAVLAEDLREASARLDALDTGELTASLRAVFSWSYHALDAETAGVFGLLGLAPGPDISLPAAASLAALPPTRVRALLRSLEVANLLQQHIPGRYRMHDLVRIYAAEQAQHDQPIDTHTAALRRVGDFYLHTAHTGERLLYPQRQPIELGKPAKGCISHPLDDENTALAWFDAEYPCVLATHHLAVKHGWHSTVWQLAWALDSFHSRRAQLHNNVAVWRAGLAAAKQLGEPVLAVAHRCLGHACARAGKHTEALDHLRQALALTEQAGDTLGQAFTHFNLALAWEHHGDDQQALAHATHALHLYQSLDNPVSQADALNAVGWYYARLGHYQQGRANCERALALYRRHDDRGGEANTLDSLGYIAHHTGHHTQAIGHYLHVLTLLRDHCDTYQEANALANLGEAYHSLGQHVNAHNAWQHALDLCQSQHRTTEAHRVQQRLTGLDEHPN
jgi:DNA-binding SARP family transcriptional activator